MSAENQRRRFWAKKAAEYLDISRSTLAKWRMSGAGPKWHRCGPRLVFYYQDELDVWLAGSDQ
jgi:predicted DNA-binding transcriptional regulator AlpA